MLDSNEQWCVSVTGVQDLLLCVGSFSTDYRFQSMLWRFRVFDQKNQTYKKEN